MYGSFLPSPRPRDDVEQPPVSHSSQLHQFKHQRANWEQFAEQNFHSPLARPSALWSPQQGRTEQRDCSRC